MSRFVAEKSIDFQITPRFVEARQTTNGVIEIRTTLSLGKDRYRTPFLRAPSGKIEA